MPDANLVEKNTAKPIRIAAAPVTWNNNDLENWRPRIPFPEILDRIAKAGYTATEYDGSFGSDPDTLLREAAARNLLFCGSYQWVDLNTTGDVVAETPSMQPTLALLAAIDCKNLIIADSLRPHRIAIAGNVPGDGSTSLNQSGFKRIAANAARIAEQADRHGIRVHYHNHVGTFVETPDEVARLLAELDLNAVDLCFDTGHYAFAGGDSLAFVAEHRDTIEYVHLKDVNSAVMAQAHTNRWSFMEALRHYVFADLGTGVAQIDKVLALLSTQPASPWIVIEQDTCEGDSTATAARNLQTVQQMLVENNEEATSH
ncbi:MAG: TIM barrel protein [Thermomicrobiales bacterium]